MLKEDDEDNLSVIFAEESFKENADFEVRGLRCFIRRQRR